MPSWIGPDYSSATDEELLTDYNRILEEIDKRFLKKKLKKK